MLYIARHAGVHAEVAFRDVQQFCHICFQIGNIRMDCDLLIDIKSFPSMIVTIIRSDFKLRQNHTISDSIRVSATPMALLLQTRSIKHITKKDKMLRQWISMISMRRGLLQMLSLPSFPVHHLLGVVLQNFRKLWYFWESFLEISGNFPAIFNPNWEPFCIAANM